MEALPTYTQPFFAWLLETTLIASVVIGLILVGQRFLGERLGPRWCHALWLVLLLRMVLPWTPPSPWSLGNLIPASIPQAWPHASVHVTEQDNRSELGVVSEGTQPKAVSPSEPTAASPQMTVIGRKAPATRKAPPAVTWPVVRRMLPLFWLAGAAALGAYLVTSNFALWRIVKRERPLLNQPILELFEACRVHMGVQTIVAIVPSDRVTTAALFGFVRPRLLLPREIIETASQEELRYIFLHELAHLKRHDICLGWLASLLQVLHWFNPLVWLAFHKMRADRELACDALVLTRTGPDESRQYGRTIVGLLERFCRTRPLPAMAGILESQSQLKRRIAMIARFQNNRYRWSPLPVTLIVVFACVALAGISEGTAVPAQTPAQRTTPQKSDAPTIRRLHVPFQLHFDAQLSPDGRSIAVVVDKRLCIVPREGALGPDYLGAARVVHTGDVNVDPYGFAWSADGRWIAFNGRAPVGAEGRAEGQEGAYRMYVVRAEGGEPRHVHDAYRGGIAHNRRMSLSPDGRILAFSAADANELHIYTVDVESRVAKRLADAPAREPVYSPDGRWIAYVEDKSRGRGGGGLWVVPANGGTPRRVADADNACSPVWSPDARMIAFHDWNADGIYVVPVGEDAAPTGKKISVDYPKEAGGLYRLTGWTPDHKIGAIFRSHAESALYVLPLRGGPPTRVTRGGHPLQPRWCPDGRQLVFARRLDQSHSSWADYGIASVPAEGGEVMVIPVEAGGKIVRRGWGGGNNVSPDGRTIVFAGRTADEAAPNSHIWTLPVGGGETRQLTDVPLPLADGFPCWSPDGKAVAFVRSRDVQNIIRRFTEADIFVISSGGGEPRQLTVEADMVAFGSIAWSPDGKLLAYLSIDDEWSTEGETLRVIPAEGGESRVVMKLRGGFEANNVELAWSPDSQRIAIVDNGIRIISLSDGSAADIDPGVVTARTYHLDWSRDGEKLVFVGEQRGDVGFWMIENFLPREARQSANTMVSSTSAPRWTNSLGMPFVPVKGTSVRFCVWETRVKDFEAFISATGRDMGNKMTCFNSDLKHDEWEGYNWKNPGYAQGPDHPVVGVNWEDAVAFCKWLTEKERKEGVLAARQVYRLPSDSEWSAAVGLKAVSRDAPGDQEQETKGVYPWGTQWPPTKGAGNYADMTARAKYGPDEFKTIEGYDDGYAEAAPVGSFEPNPCGLYDMGGNVLEWCGYWVSSDTDEYRSLRGASWLQGDTDSLHSRYHIGQPPSRASSPDCRSSYIGFRAVLEH